VKPTTLFVQQKRNLVNVIIAGFLFTGNKNVRQENMIQWEVARRSSVRLRENGIRTTASMTQC
jgi:hypothetical protein